MIITKTDMWLYVIIIMTSVMTISVTMTPLARRHGGSCGSAWFGHTHRAASWRAEAARPNNRCNDNDKVLAGHTVLPINGPRVSTAADPFERQQNKKRGQRKLARGGWQRSTEDGWRETDEPQAWAFFLRAGGWGEWGWHTWRWQSWWTRDSAIVTCRPQLYRP